MHGIRLIVGFVAICVLAAVVVGQEKAAPTEIVLPAIPSRDSQALIVNERADKASADEAAAAFDKAFTEYRDAIRRIEQLRIEYQTAEIGRRDKINAELPGLAANAQKLVTNMVDAAMEAYRLAPNDDPRATDLLVTMARHLVVGEQTGPGEPASEQQPERKFYPMQGGEQYERALPIIKRLADGSAAEKSLYIWGFLAAFSTNDFDLADAYWKKSQEAKAIEDLAKVADNDKDPQAGAAWQTLSLVAKYSSAVGKYRDLWAKESAIRAAEAKADDLPRVKLITTKGEITLELFENEAPQSVASFLTLVKQGFYNGSPFHRVLPGFMAQGGAKTDDGWGGPNYCIRSECSLPNARKHFRGSLSMAHKPNLPDSGSSQFFLTFVPTGYLDGEHTVFGRVLEGFDVLGQLQKRSPTQQEHLPKADRIIKAEVLRDRGHEYKFERLPEQ